VTRLFAYGCSKSVIQLINNIEHLVVVGSLNRRPVSSIVWIAPGTASRGAERLLAIMAKSGVGNGDIEQKPLSLVFYDLNDPEDKNFWAGTAAHIIHGLRKAGHDVYSSGPHIPFTRRGILWLWYNFYLRFRGKQYHPDRHLAMTWLYTQLGNWKLRKYRRADAILTVSPPFTAFLTTQQPIFLSTDATWGQIVETYPYFSESNQPACVVQGGYRLDELAFKRENVQVVMTSRWAAERAMRDYEVPEQRMNILPYAANFEEDPSDETVERGLANRGHGECQLLFVGREWDRKGGPLAVQIAAELQGLGVPTRLHVVGCSPPEMPPYVQVYGLLSKDKPEDRELLTRLYANSDFFVMPTRAEAQGIVFNEAAAYALPVAATDVGGVSSVVRNGDWGLLLPLESSPRTYAEWLQALYQNRERYEKTARSARQDFLTRLNNKAYVDQLVRIIREKIAHRAGLNHD
jgi:glycosyltransferase involved in cell wall biosynthesis